MTVTQPFPHPGSPAETEHGTVFTPKFDAEGLIPAIVTGADDGATLMFAWMNVEALALTLATRQAHFWSRSRRKIWLKGEESGNILQIQEIRVDCDQDVLLLRALLTGAQVACHTGARSCFYRAVELGAPPPTGARLIALPGGPPVAAR